MKRIGTQRAWATYNSDRTLDSVDAYDVADVPVLVIPESDVCRSAGHNWLYGNPEIDWCDDCGAARFDGKIRRPRILRVARGKK